MTGNRCGARLPVEGTKTVFVCYRAKGHDGHHEGSTLWGKGKSRWA